jgi:hypothetical protein
MLLFFDIQRVDGGRAMTEKSKKKRSLLAALDAVLLVAMGLAALTALASLLDAVLDDKVTDLTIGLPAEAVTEALPDDVSLDESQAVVHASVGVGYRIAWWLVGPGTSLLVVAGAWVLRDVVASARKGDPFVAANVRRLRLVAGITLAYGVLALLRVPVALMIQDELGVEDSTANASALPIAAAIVLFALAEIWQRGVDLRDEQELTV